MRTKFLIIGDLHGNKPKIHFKDFDAIIAPGDFCSDDARPYIFKAMKLKMENPKSKIKSWIDFVGKKKARQMIKKSMRDGREILEQLNTYGVPIYAVPGNWDWDDKMKEKLYKYLIKGLKNVVDVYHKRINIDGYQIIGHGYTSGPEYPQHKEELKMLKLREKKKMKKEYNRTYTKINSLFTKSNKKPIIFISHNVPFNTPLDMITNKQSPRYRYHFGSLIARQMITKYKPLLCIGGHMHEHFTKYKLGKTICINAGFGGQVNTLLNLENGKIKSIKFYPKEYG
ncbi:MAG TPA: metallophosphoesterase [Candidatus Nanoarchaeia archaeon]|nr:metallophosphoesterase [Candidatus Nanoarchaeia archaeon]